MDTRDRRPDVQELIAANGEPPKTVPIIIAVDVFRRQWWRVAIAIVLGAAAGYAYAVTRPTSYTAIARTRIPASAIPGPTGLIGASVGTQPDPQVLLPVITSPVTLALALSRSSPPVAGMTVEGLRSAVVPELVRAQNIIDIKVTLPDAGAASALATAIAHASAEKGRDLATADTRDAMGRLQQAIDKQKNDADKIRARLIAFHRAHPQRDLDAAAKEIAKQHARLIELGPEIAQLQAELATSRRALGAATPGAAGEGSDLARQNLLTSINATSARLEGLKILQATLGDAVAGSAASRAFNQAFEASIELSRLRAESKRADASYAAFAERYRIVEADMLANGLGLEVFQDAGLAVPSRRSSLSAMVIGSFAALALVLVWISVSEALRFADRLSVKSRKADR